MSNGRGQFHGSAVKDLFNSRSIWSNQVKNFLLITEKFLSITPQQVDLSHNNTNLNQKSKTTQDAWDSSHVRLPCSDKSVYKGEAKNGRKFTKSRWRLIEETLRKPIRSSRELEKAIKTYNPRYAHKWSFSTLHKFFKIDPQSSAVFFKYTLPGIINTALKLPDIIKTPIPFLKQSMYASITMNQQQAACLLANAFLCTFPHRNVESSYPEINFSRLYGTNGDNVIEKLKCISNYFDRVLRVGFTSNVITFQRRTIIRQVNWQNSEVSLAKTKFHISSDTRIEEADGMLQVDFANRMVGGGVLGNGCVQEEIRFAISPEMIVAKLFTQSLRSDEALLMIGCEQFSAYTGYASTFRWAGDFVDRTPRDSHNRRDCRVVAIDAIHYNNNYDQFREENIRRDLHKAYVGLAGDAGDKAPVATGLWGCGAFNGHPIRSALIQFMVCAVVNRNMAFFTFRNIQTQNEVADILSFLVSRKVTVGQLYEVLRKFRTHGTPGDPSQLAAFVKANVGKPARQLTEQPVERPQFTSQQVQTPTTFERMREEAAYEPPPPKKKSSLLCCFGR